MIVDGKKYACATCIKGHRSSSCAHADRPLHEVKPKGRPISQCEHCRDLRKTKQVHVKCNCNPRAVEEDERPKRKKPRNATPPPATFPNGLPGALPSTSALKAVAPKTKRRRIAKASKSCRCDETGECGCSSQAMKQESPTPPPDDHSAVMNSLLLAVAEAGLAHQTASASVASSSALAMQSFGLQPGPSRVFGPPIGGAGSSCCNPPPASERPISGDSSPNSESMVESFNPFALSSLARCHCGDGCACPGCVEHRGMDALTSSESCPTACSSCLSCLVHSAVIADPRPAVSDWLESAAAILPEPPDTSKSSNPFHLDPTNVTIYPSIVWENDGAARAAGLVKVPRLCCGGKCGCPTGQCACLDDCCGCCTGCACAEHKTMPHYVGYQGPLRCSYEVSGVRASCCEDGDDDNRASGSGEHDSPSKTFAAALKRIASQSPLHKSWSDNVSSISALSRSLSRQRATSTLSAGPSSPQSQTPTDSPMPRVPFQPAPGPFTLGRPDPHLLTTLPDQGFVRG